MVENKCLAASHGNCCSIRAGEDYCLYHKPSKSSDEALEFYKKLKKQATTEADDPDKVKLIFNDNVDWRGYCFPKRPVDEKFCFKVATFKGWVDFGDATFEGWVDFDDAIFKDYTIFERASFKGGANFSDAIFKGKANFGDVTFKGEANFGDANFKGWANFKDASFKGETDFGSTNFKDWAEFGDATFEGITYFVSTTFKGWAGFRDATFEDRVTFFWSTFKGGASFKVATFKGEADFDGATFEDSAIFNGGLFMGETSFSVALFERRCTFANCKFYNKLIFTNTDFRQGVVMEGDWEINEPEKYRLPQAEQEGCRVQRIAYEKEGRKDAADAMFVREMRAGRRGRAILYQEKEFILTPHSKPLWDTKKPLLHKFCWGNLFSHINSKGEYLLADLTCKYGTSWQRVITTSLGLVVFFLCVYLIGAHLSSTYPCVGGIYRAQSTAIEVFLDLKTKNEAIALEAKTQDMLLVKNFGDLIYFSINTFIPVSYSDMYPVGLMKYIASAQSLIGAFYIALFVVVFARKWMR